MDTDMRPLEWLTTAASLLAMLSLLQPGLPHLLLWLGLTAVLLLCVHAWFEGMHWQMAPAYAATLLLLLFAFLGETSVLSRWFCGILVGAMVAASLCFSWILPMFKLPAPTGRYPVGTCTLNFVDLNRLEMHGGAKPGNREVVAQLWYPSATVKWKKAMYRRKNETSFRSSYQAVLKTHSLQDAPVAAGRFPVILYNSAWWGFRNRSTFMTQDLASHGFVVVALSHPYNSSMVELRDGSVANPDYSLDLGFSLARHLQLDERFAIADEELAIQTADSRFVLDELEKLDGTPGHPLESSLHMNRVGAYGYSFGGAVSVELAREDSRVLAAMELDGVLHGASARHGLDKPVLMIDSPWMLSPGEHTTSWAPKTLGDARVAETATLWNTIAESKARLLERFGGCRVIIRGLGHGGFTDQVFMSPLRKLSNAGEVAPKRAAGILNSYAVAFFAQTLLGMPSSLFSETANDFPEVAVEVWSRSERLWPV